jgi:large subunit ribosomal protein L7/L12
MNERRWPAAVTEIGDRLAALTADGAAELAAYLGRAYGVRAAAVFGLPPVEPEVVVIDATLEPDVFDVRYDGFEPARKIKAIQAVRSLLGLGLKEARDLVEGPPTVIKRQLPREEAEALKKQLGEWGAKASVVR